jgi:nucleoside-diphosphate-sugar epimerase
MAEGGGMKIVVLGLGYTAKAFLRHLDPGTEVVATRRPGFEEQHDAAAEMRPLLRTFPGEEAALRSDLAEADAVLVSVPPDAALPPPHDPVLATFGDALRQAKTLRWLGYLSTIGVYGDHGGAWVDESTPPLPKSRRSRARLLAENAWLELATAGVPAHVFRLAGIYGPGRSAFEKIEDGSARRVVKPGQVFNRIHVNDIARVLLASMARPRPGAVYNVTDDEPAPPQDVIMEAARLLGVPPPPEVPFDAAELSPMAASFWGETKRVSNHLVREELDVRLACPTYREGLRSILASRNAPGP